MKTGVSMHQDGVEGTEFTEREREWNRERERTVYTIVEEE